MDQNDLTLYFLSEDVKNAKERVEIEYLRRIGRVVLVSVDRGGEEPGGVDHVKLKPLSPGLLRASILWTKACYLLGRLAKSRTDLHFPDRNVYTGHRFFRSFINALWAFKTLSCVNALLPRYDTLFFLPFRLMRILAGPKWERVPGPQIVIHDSLLLRLPHFAPFIAAARSAGIKTLANVKSWDNPFYSQFCTRADGYIVWSESMWRDVKAAQGVEAGFLEAWGARPFYNFHRACRDFKRALPLPAAKTQAGPVIGYAAAFTDELMGRHEIEVIKTFAGKLRDILPGAVLRFRPYPILPRSFYKDLENCANIAIVDIEGGLIDRYGDGREMIRFGSDRERLDYLSGCDCFLSMATSFTIEAVIYGLPVVHFRLSGGQQITEAETEIFKRVAISDHLNEYYEKNLLLAESYDDLLRYFSSLKTLETKLKELNVNFLKRVGIPGLDQEWPLPTAAIARFAAESAAG